MVEWLGWMSLGHEMYCHDLEVMGLIPGWVELRVRSTSVLGVPEPKMLKVLVMKAIISQGPEENTGTALLFPNNARRTDTYNACI